MLHTHTHTHTHAHTHTRTHTHAHTHIYNTLCNTQFRTEYLVVELSPGVEIQCVYVISINDGTPILTILGIHNNRDFQNSRFFCGNLIILNPELH